jgi:hypothetical protein
MVQRGTMPSTAESHVLLNELDHRANCMQLNFHTTAQLLNNTLHHSEITQQRYSRLHHAAFRISENYTICNLCNLH